MKNEQLRFAIVAGEDSGDILGASLIQALKKRFPHATFEGVGGKRMISEGFHSFYPLERLSVMGFIEPLKRLRELLKLRKWLIQHFLKLQPHVFIGIDAPDFNLTIEKALKKKKIKTVHYVSPTVWAWRSKRIHNIKKSVDLMLTLFPFEMAIYEQHAIPVCCVGHPLADAIPLVSDKNIARTALHLPADKKIIALLPGSREQELRFLAKDFIHAAQWILRQNAEICFISATPNVDRKKQLADYAKECDFTFKEIFTDKASEVMAAADAILVASGTASLQAMLIKRPTLIAYKMSALTFRLAKWLIKVPFIGLPNLLAGKRIMLEFIQDDIKPESMGKLLLEYVENPSANQENIHIFEKLHKELRRDAGETAAQKISELITELPRA